MPFRTTCVEDGRDHQRRKQKQSRQRHDHEGFAGLATSASRDVRLRRRFPLVLPAVTRQSSLRLVREIQKSTGGAAIFGGSRRRSVEAAAVVLIDRSEPASIAVRV